MSKQYKYVHLLSYEKEKAGLGKPLGRVSYKIQLVSWDPVKEIQTPRPREEIEAEIAKLKADTKAQNMAFLAAGNRRDTNLGANSSEIPIVHQNPKIDTNNDDRGHKPQEIPRSITTYAYEPLKLILDPDTGNTTCIFGSSKRGKSTTMMKIYEEYYKPYIPKKTYKGKNAIIPFLFAKSIQINLYNAKGLIKSDKFRPEFIDAQRKINRYSKNSHSFVNFIDDFINLKHSLTLDDLILTLRNSNISTVICLQYVNTLSKPARSNVNNVLLFGQNTDEAAEVCINVYLKSWFKSQKIPEPDQVPIFHKITADHGFFHIHPSTGKVTICKLAI